MNTHHHQQQQQQQVDVARVNNKLSEDESRKMILESYEKAGVDLPLVTLETVLDREIAEYDDRQKGAPRFRKFLSKASSAIANRKNSYGNDGDENKSPENVPDDENMIASPFGVSSSFAPSTHSSKKELHPQELEEAIPKPQTPSKNDTTAESLPPITTVTPEKTGNNCHPTFDFCCPEGAAQPSPNRSVASSDKYVMSHLQLAEEFQDEHYSVATPGTRDIPRSDGC